MMESLKSKLISTILVLLVLTLVLIYFFGISFNVYSIKKVEIIENNDITYELKDDDIKLILKSFKNTDIAENISTENLMSYKCKIVTKFNRSLSKVIFIDLESEKVYLKDLSDKKVYKISDEYKLFYFTNDTFKDIYENGNPPSLNIILDGKKLSHSTNAKWQYKKIDDKYYNSNLDYKSHKVYNFYKEKNIKLTYNKKPKKVEYSLYQKSSIIDKGNIIDNTFEVPDTDGAYRLIIKTYYNNESEGYKGIIESEINFVMDLPAKFSLEKDSVEQGNIIKVSVKNLNDSEIPFINQKIYKSFSFSEITNGSTYGYIPTSYKMGSGKYNISYGVNNKESGNLTLNVLPRDFNIQYLKVDKKTEKSTRNDKAYEQFVNYFTPVRNQSDKDAYFNKPFIIPVKGRISTEYGERRYVNNAPTTYRHSGLDIAAPKGTKIFATNTGKIKLSMNLTLTGNTIVIDHGAGFFSVYYHMNERYVKEGDMVTIGQEIGEVGSTGFSTGPHLHFMISYYTQNLEPGYLIYNEPVTYENYKSLFNIK